MFKRVIISLSLIASTVFFYTSFAGLNNYMGGREIFRFFHKYNIYMNSNSEIKYIHYREIKQSEAFFKPSTYLNWYIQLTGDLRKDIPAEVYDVDLFDTSEETIKELKESGKKVICYFNAGAYEDWREDAYKFDPEDIGNEMEGWEGEYWLNINSENVKKIMIDRLKLAKEKGCDGVDPDNVNGYTQNTGFVIAYEDQLEYNRFLSNEAHKLGLSIGLKNDLEQIKDLVNYFDFAINEECHQYNECDLLNPFIQNGKPVINIEYDKKYINNRSEFLNLCKDAHRRGLKTLVMPVDLDGSFVKSCDYGEF